MNVPTKVACLLIIAGNSFAQTPKIHELKASPQTVHRGFLDASLKPVLTVGSGDIVKLETATGNPRYFEKLGVPQIRYPPSCMPPSKAWRATDEEIIR